MTKISGTNVLAKQSLIASNHATIHHHAPVIITSECDVLLRHTTCSHVADNLLVNTQPSTTLQPHLLIGRCYEGAWHVPI